MSAKARTVSTEQELWDEILDVDQSLETIRKTTHVPTGTVVALWDLTASKTVGPQRPTPERLELVRQAIRNDALYNTGPINCLTDILDLQENNQGEVQKRFNDALEDPRSNW